jgi:hypothetical protein
VAAIAPIDELIEVTPSLARFADFPMTLDFLLDYPGGGLTWVGTYGPTMGWEEGAVRCSELMRSYGVPPLLVTRPMKGGHYGVLRMISLFDKSDPDEVAKKSDPDEVAKVKDLNQELLRLTLDLGYIPYKAPGWAAAGMEDRMDPGFRKLLGDVKGLLDPAGIMNPGRWGL